MVSPGPISTPLYGKLPFPEAQRKAIAASIQSQIPAGRFANPSEIAQAIVYLSSDRASFITGQILGVDGGKLV